MILYHSLAALAAWDKAGLRVPTVAVNFSAAELRNPRLTEKLKWELDRFGLSPDRLSVGILETVVADTDNDVVVSNIAQLARVGCGIDLDDFGTGHASITNIRRFAVRRIKIDRSFVTKVDEDREQQKMVPGRPFAGRAAGHRYPCRRGRGRRESMRCCRSWDAAHVQGFVIGRPMPFADTASWITTHRAKVTGTPRITHRAR